MIGAINIEDSATIFCGQPKICKVYSVTISKNNENFAAIWEKSNEWICDHKKTMDRGFEIRYFWHDFQKRMDKLDFS